MEITIFEVHLPEAQFNAPFASGTPQSPPEDGDAADEPLGDEPEKEGPNLAPLVVLLVLLGIAAIARSLRRPGQTELDEFEGE